MFKTGLIKNIDAKNYRARVEFPDQDNMLSNWLPLGVRFAMNDKEYGLPSINENVCCLMDENLEDGVILCALYNSEDLPPVEDESKYHIEFKDGTVLEYDKAEHKLTADIQGTADIIANGNVSLTCPAVNITAEVNITGNIVASGTVTASNVISGGKSVNGHVHTNPEGGNTGAF